MLALRWVGLLTLLITVSGATSSADVHFRSVDILIDPHGQPLAAYQLEFTGESENVKLVGIEGGAHPAFKDPPYYDPAALMHSRVILAALNAGDDLPTSRTRVVRLHLEITGDHPSFRARLIVVAKSDGSPIAADVRVEEEGERP